MIRIEQLRYRVGEFALQDVSLHIRAGEYFVLLGSSGAGKTLLLESLCGLSRIDSGRVAIDGVDVTHHNPRRRRIGYLPQDYALFPHMSVRQNAAFGLRYSASSRLEKQQRLDELLEMLGIVHLANRRTRRLSGGEKQRVALARALAIQPQVLLLDEPVSALDEQTRDSLCAQLRQLQQQTGTTTLHVCHNFAEMLAVGDRAAVIERGRIIQVGEPREILDRPCNVSVARFVQAKNLLPATGRADGEWLHLTCAAGLQFRASRTTAGEVGGEMMVMVRPENISLSAGPTKQASSVASTWEGVVRQLTDVGASLRATVACAEEIELVVSVGRMEFVSCPFAPGDRVLLSVEPADVHVLPATSS